ncbi:DUF3325 family protein [Marinimicrobium sp. C6131]|uniref:DUF3325 family protein n=1 Tax=Marinimicrobium sp. C6131 TaxID=3022676 RepID=UPI00223D927D|nr:DUF3325 family protein [Marinimicrobium sp. C6131]UZJ44170.1 DUF3325 family protein [Marinimicrobium sp. C6131]
MTGVVIALFVSQLLLALSLPAHLRTLTPVLARNPARFRRLALALRSIGYPLLTASAALAMVHWGPALGLTYWFGLFALTGLSAALGLEFLNRRHAR